MGGQATNLLKRAVDSGEETREIRRLWAAACRVLGEVLEDETEERRMFQEAVDRYTGLVEEDADDAEAWAGLGDSAQAWAECFEDAPPTLDGMRAAFRTAESAFGRAGLGTPSGRRTPSVPCTGITGRFRSYRPSGRICEKP